MAEKAEKAKVQFRQSIVVRFSGDSGDGMQLAGNIFSNVSAGLGDRISTFPDYPAEVRAPQGSLGVYPDSRFTLAMECTLLVTNAMCWWQ